MWLKKWHDKHKPLRESLTDSRLYGIFGDQIFHHMLWRNDKRSIAGGLSLGLFIAFTPTIPFQMILATGGALFFRVNLPVALAACWITNPLTFLPVYMSAWKVGKYVVDHFILIEEVLKLYPLRTRSGRLMQQTIYLWIGRRALTRYMVFESWHHLMDFMIRGLELEARLEAGFNTS